MSSELWLIIAGGAAVTAAIKAAGPIALGGRELPGWAGGVIELMAPALLAALIVTAALADGDRIAAGAETAGVGLAGIALWRGASILAGVGIAVVVTAGLRALG
ncbi:MAG: AzlD domain-containing protein [Solirubrobacteraceae bacterium]